MKRFIAVITTALAVFISPVPAMAQSAAVPPAKDPVLYAAPAVDVTPQGAAEAPPTLVRITGRLAARPDAKRPDTVLLTLALYESQDAPTPLWMEQQAVAVDADGRYTAFAGATLPAGLPRELFASSAARWLGVTATGEVEQPRIMLLSVPYALKARDAETLGGKTTADFVLTDQLTDSVKSTLKAEGVKTNDVSKDSSLGPLVSTAGRIAKFSDTINTTVDSIISESSGSIGIATSAPAGRLEVASAIKAAPLLVSSSEPSLVLRRTVADTTSAGVLDFQTSTGAVKWRIGSQQMVGGSNLEIIEGDNVSNRVTILPGGRVGIGTTAPAQLLDVNGPTTFRGSVSVSTGGAAITGNSFINGSLQLVGSTPSYIGSPANGFVFQNAAATLNLLTLSNAGDATFPSGNVGIGTSSPASKLDVNGNINVTGNINAKYQDVAEWVEVSAPLPAGTVVIVDPRNSNQVIPAPRAYDTRVAGAVSAQPGLILGEGSDTKAMIAQSGRVRIKVDASYGAIRIGDLLVTSPTPGYAMRSKPMKVGGQSLHRPGTLLGKALEALPNGKGEILVLLTLQ